MRSVSYLPCCQRQHLISIEIIHHELEWVGGWRSVTWRLLHGVWVGDAVACAAESNGDMAWCNDMKCGVCVWSFA
jgi:hypothetical protein